MSAHSYLKPDVETTGDMLVGAALLARSFSADLSTWRLTVSQQGEVTQELRTGFGSIIYDPVTILLRGRATEAEIETIQATIEVIGFDSLEGRYGADTCADLQTTAIHTQANRVEVYGAGFLANEGNSAVTGYLRLWDQIAAIAPYQGTKTERRSEDEILNWNRALFGNLSRETKPA